MDARAFTQQKLKKRKKLNPHNADMSTNASTVPYANAAAGHEGLLSTTSGTVLIKPCQQSEIDFYTSASTSAAHALFYAHMPQFLGVLRETPDRQGLAPILDQMGGAVGTDIAEQVAQTHARVASQSSYPPPAQGLNRPTTTTDISSKRSSWKPSGGKKVQTGLAIVMENATAGFSKPCVLDVKLGARLWADDAPMSKRRKLDDVSKVTTSGSLGFRVAGMTVWTGEDSLDKVDGKTKVQVDGQEQDVVEVKEGYRKYNKHYGRVFKAEDVGEAFETYLGRGKHRKMVARRLVRELESIQFVLQEMETRMYSASVLMVYEGDEKAFERAVRFQEDNEGEPRTNGWNQVDREESDEGAGEEDDEDEDAIEPKVHDVRLIDFAHAKFTPGEGHDDNALRGVKSVLEILRTLV